jgi:hypothetical protein
MTTKMMRWVAVGAACAGMTGVAWGQALGLDLAGPVNVAGSDTRAANFQQNVLPSMTAFLNQTLGETKRLNDSMFLLDPAKLTLKTDADVRVYFVGEGAGYQNTLGYNASGSGVASGDPQIIFPNASSPVSTYDPARTTARTTAAPLLPGDFSNLGSFVGGTRLDFFLIANGAQGGQSVYSTDSSVNPDGINHVVSFAYAAVGSPYLILGFEDLLGGGDKDFNDVLIAIDIGVKNVAALLATPEPALVWVLGSFVGLVVWRKRGLARDGVRAAA